MTAVLDHLKQLPVIFINLDRSPDRLIIFESSVAPLFAQSIRQPAMDGQGVPEQTVAQFVKDWTRICEERKDELSSINRPPGANFRKATQAANYAIMRSHLAALHYGATHFPRFCVAEDDIMPKSALFDEDVPLPHRSNDISIWSGGLPMAALQTDDDAYSGGRPLEWRPIPTDRNAHNTLGAGLIEVTAQAAVCIIQQVYANPMAYDHAWGFALKMLKGQRLFPTGFGQMGASIRNGKARDQVLSR